MDQADDELRETIKNIWPLQAKNMVDLLVPPGHQLNAGKLTVGKIYAGLLILESWRSTRFGQVEPAGLPVSEIISKITDANICSQDIQCDHFVKSIDQLVCTCRTTKSHL